MDIKYIGEKALSHLISKCKETFALINHTHTASDVGADTTGSASAALALAEQYTNEQIETVEESLDKKLETSVFEEYKAEINETVDGKTEKYTVTITYDSTTDSYSADKTYDEVTEALDKNLVVEAVYQGYVYRYVGKDIKANVWRHLFELYWLNEGKVDEYFGIEKRVITVQSNGYAYHFIWTADLGTLMGDKTVSWLETTDKTISGAINELNSGKADADHVHSWNDLEDKPFGEEIGLATIIPETNVTATGTSATTLAKIDGINSSILTKGQTYTVTFDGIEYEVTSAEDSLTGGQYLGNILGMTGDYPFCILDDVDGYSYAREAGVYLIAEAGEHTVKVETESEVLVKLDEKYLPDHTHSWNDLTDKPFGTKELEYFYNDAVTVEGTTATIYPNRSVGNGDTYQVYIWGSSAYDGTMTSHSATNYGINQLTFESGNIPIESIMWNASSTNNEYTITFTQDMTGTFTLQVYELDQDIIDELDEKFIPDTIARTEDIPEHTWESLPDKPFGETVLTFIEVASTTVEESNVEVTIGAVDQGGYSKPLKVDYNGNEYIFDSYFPLGDETLTEYPFYIYNKNLGGGYSQRYIKTADSNVNVVLYQSSTSETTLDSKYLPTNVPVLEYGIENAPIIVGNVDQYGRPSSYTTDISLVDIRVIFAVDDSGVCSTSSDFLEIYNSHKTRQIRGYYNVGGSYWPLTLTNISEVGCSFHSVLTIDEKPMLYRFRLQADNTATFSTTPLADADHTHSWDELEDTPFASEMISIDFGKSADTTGLTSVNNLYKVSSYDGDILDFIGANVVCTYEGGYKNGSNILTDSNIDTNNNYAYLYKHDMYWFVCTFEDNTLLDDGTTIPESGIWLLLDTSKGTYVESVKVTSIKTIDEIYIPSSIARTSDYISKTNTSEYSPTSDYNPATKKYVDDTSETLKESISNLPVNEITTTVENPIYLIDLPVGLNKIIFGEGVDKLSLSEDLPDECFNHDSDTLFVLISGENDDSKYGFVFYDYWYNCYMYKIIIDKTSSPITLDKYYVLTADPNEDRIDFLLTQRGSTSTLALFFTGTNSSPITLNTLREERGYSTRPFVLSGYYKVLESDSEIIKLTNSVTAICVTNDSSNGYHTWYLYDKNKITCYVVDVDNDTYTTHIFMETGDISNLNTTGETIVEAINEVNEKASAQADWNENDESSKAFIKNKPFDKIETESVLVDESTLSTWIEYNDTVVAEVEYNNMSEVSTYAISPSVLALNTTYKVTWDGTEYDLVCFLDNTNGYYHCLGGTIDNFEEYPFSIVNDLIYLYVYIPASEGTSVSHTLKISVDTVEYITIDENYIPDSIARQSSLQDYATSRNLVEHSSSLSYNGFSYNSYYKSYAYFLTEAGLWKIESQEAYFGTADFRLMYDSSSGTITLYLVEYVDGSAVLSESNFMYATLYDINTGSILKSDDYISSVTIGEYSKCCGNIILYVDSNTVDLEDIHSFDDPLPLVTSDDNGSVLKVVDGVWAKAEAPKQVFMITATKTSTASEEGIETAAITPDYTLDKTFEEITAAINAGHLPVLYMSDTTYMLNLVAYGTDYITFGYLLPLTNTQIASYMFYVTSDTCAYEQTPYFIVPHVASANEGQILSIVNGVPTWIDFPTATDDEVTTMLNELGLTETE